MTKITDKHYYLQKVDALNGIELLSTGTTQPMLIRGVCEQTGEKSDYVIKYRRSPRMSVESSAFELIAAFIAKELELDVPEPALINVSPEFVDTLRGKEGFIFANNSIGLNFGCSFLGYGFMQLLQNQKLTESQFEQAIKIFAFDILISNADRNINKPNLLTNGEKIFIFDHELAFGFVRDIIKSPKPWIIRDVDLTWIKSHFFYLILKGSEPNFDNFFESFEVLNDNFWDTVNTLIPDEWAPIQLIEIRKYLCALVSNRNVFLQQLIKVLS